MSPRKYDAVVMTVPVVVVLVATALLVLTTAGRKPALPHDAVPSAVPTALPAPGTASTLPVETGKPRPSGRPKDRPGPGAPTATSSVCVPVGEQRRLRVMSFNIHSARTKSGYPRLATIADELSRWEADVLLLQEVDRGRAWTGRVDMPAVLADRLGMHWAFGANVRRSASNEYGTAILSRYPIVGSRNLPLPAPPGTQQRGLLHATLDVDGVQVSVYNTHLEHTSSEARVRQARTIAPVLDADPLPKILGGDLNAAPGSPVLGTIRAHVADTWPTVGEGDGLTAPAGNPRVRIDYLLYAGGAGVEVTPLTAQLLTSAVSDHKAVWAVYDLATSDADVCVPVLPDVVPGD